ncbi:GNAT family N-acetyltransferase [Christensenella intestinihominis]|uniref:GNAT family N-acetyltransferase n=1 Tax=Christensenella intestinihominis TaxID=1851429 RepID=UPI00082A18FF|nr:GNAT family protein [Christensenella intestinihominis]
MDFVLRKWTEEDIACVQKYANNEKIAANLRNAFPYPYAMDDAGAYIRSCIEKDGQGQVVRAIVADGRAAGSIGVFFGTDVYEKSAEIGYWLGEPFWGHGIMSEAVSRICRYVFAKYEIERIYAEPFARNRASRRVLEKAGFILEGVLRDSVYKNGVLQDSCMYALLRQ